MKLRFRKLDILIAGMMSCVMSAFFSGFYTFLAFGVSFQWLEAWLFGFAQGWPIAAALAFVLGRPIRNFAARLAGVELR